MRELNTLLQTVEAISPIAMKALTSGQLVSPACEMVDADPDVLCEYEVEIPVRGDVVLTANVFRSKRAEQSSTALPVIMCAHPYDNRKTASQNGTPLGGPPQQYRIIPQERPPRFSRLTSWESPDPNFWVQAGYAVVNLNLPGYASSGGSPSVFGANQAEGYHDAIEWVARQPWSSGAVGLNGVSFLAISQYYVAAGVRGGRPPQALKAICPWEGLSNPFDVFVSGGLRETGFPAFWWSTEVKTTINGSVEDFLAVEGCLPTEFAQQHPTYDEFWEAKRPKLSRIEVPILVCASFSDHNLHTQGSFRAFREVSSPHKWLFTHRGGKWTYYYSQDVQELTRRFMDCFVKGDETNGFLETPRVRLEVRSSLNEIKEVRSESEWPLSGTSYEKLYLAPEGRLSVEVPSESKVGFEAKAGHSAFTWTFPEATEVTGYMSARLSLRLEATGGGAPPDDIGLAVYVRKLDAKGTVVPFYGSVGSEDDAVSRGYLRGALRALDEEASTPWLPVISGLKEEPLRPHERFEAHVALYETSVFFHPGETLELLVAGHEMIASNPYKKDMSFNRGRCLIHLGGEHPSYLQVPRI